MSSNGEDNIQPHPYPHHEPEEGSECSVCMDDLDSGNYAEYRAGADMPWLPSPYCVTCIEVILKRQFTDYKQMIEGSKCAAEFRRLFTLGPPINLRDPKAFPCSGDGEVHSFWFMHDSQIHSAKLEGSLQGEARAEYWNYLRAFQPPPKEGGKEEDDEEEERGKEMGDEKDEKEQGNRGGGGGRGEGGEIKTAVKT
ncbi:conserved plasmodium protein [Nannochloropsis oceanica]